MLEIEEIIREYYLKPSLDNFIALFKMKFNLLTKTLPLEFEVKEEKYIVFLNQPNLENHFKYKDYKNVVTIVDDSKKSYIKIFKNKIEVYSETYTIF